MADEPLADGDLGDAMWGERSPGLGDTGEPGENGAVVEEMITMEDVPVTETIPLTKVRRGWLPWKEVVVTMEPALNWQHFSHNNNKKSYLLKDSFARDLLSCITPAVRKWFMLKLLKKNNLFNFSFIKTFMMKINL